MANVDHDAEIARMQPRLFAHLAQSSPLVAPKHLPLLSHTESGAVYQKMIARLS
jgi:hypothetical protein